MKLIWATRGHSWGFRFLLDGGFADPLAVYERAFAALEDERTVCRRAGGRLALRFPDPLGRKDAAGRVIPHDFVVPGAAAQDVGSVEEGIRVIWPLVAHGYEHVWLDKQPPSAGSIQRAIDGN